MPRALLPVLLTVFLDLVGFGIVIPLLPFYALETGATALQVTLLMACYSLAQFLMAPTWGALSDRFGRRPILLLSIFATALGLAGFAWADTLVTLFLFRTLHGAAAANISTAQAAVADLTTPETRAKGMGLIGAAFGVGFTVGPFLGGELSRGGNVELPIWVAAGLSLINLILAAVFLPETRRPGAEARHRTISVQAFAQALRHPRVGLLVALTFAITTAFALMESTFTLFADQVHQLDAVALGRMFGVAGVVAIVVQGGLIGRLVRRFGEARLVPFGVGLMAAGLGLLPLAPPTAGLVAVFVLISLGQSLVTPSLNSLVSRAAGDAQGFLLGTNQSMGALARAVGPALGGLLFTGWSPRGPFWFSAVLLAACVALAVAATRRASSGGPPVT